MIPLTAEDEASRLATWMMLIRGHDVALHKHSLAVADLATYFAAYLGVKQEHVHPLRRGALLHDVGKLALPLSILNKPGPLTQEEFVLVQAHPHRGSSFLRASGETDPMILSIVENHHERLDGSGYPLGLSAERIPWFVRVVTLCDVFVAITEKRAYDDAQSWQAALERMFLKNTRLDMELLREFADMIVERNEPRDRWALLRVLNRRQVDDRPKVQLESRRGRDTSSGDRDIACR